MMQLMPLLMSLKINHRRIKNRDSKDLNSLLVNIERMSCLYIIVITEA